MSLGVLCLLLLAEGRAAAVRYPGFLSRSPSEEQPRVYLGDDAGEKLILSRYIEAGQVEVARNLSRVTGEPFPQDIPSYSGFFTVNTTYDSNLFFWFFPAEKDYENAPVILWLQGGPGASSLYGLFMEVGPFFVAEDGASLIRNPYSWHKNHSIIFIDSPAGTGFSYTSNAGYVTNQNEVGEQLHSAMVQFFTMFPELQKNHFFICGESYAGKYIPALGHTIHTKNPKAKLKINLKGMAIGDGLVDPVNMLGYSDLVYQWGLIDNSTWKLMQKYEGVAARHIAAGKYKLAVQTVNDYLLGTIGSKASVGAYNLLTDSDAIDNHYAKLFESGSVRSAMHVGKQKYYPSSGTVYDRLVEDIMKSVRPWVEELLDAGYRVVFYNGQLDIIVAYSLTVNMVENLKFNAAEEYKTVRRNVWRVNGRVAGYTKTAGNMTEVMVRDAGHMVPADQPAVGFHLIYSITRNTLR
ncbi:hypothetical protein PR048_025912 [Dryococelus australis]|uniref:Carboxypeptidase n=1 Tax=Dryococelus australis TaxID=614101 RepID=A0ABQ9GJU5_9NEOP|nr:hypothetical protein PR048_025912 [Dryococelus australis]